MSPRQAALIATLGVLVLALVVIVAFLVGRATMGGGPTSAATSGPQATPTPTAAATPTAAPTAAPTTAPTARPTPAPTGQAVLTFSVPQTVKCDAADQTTPPVHLSWTTANATGVTISIDGPGKFADYPASGSADLPFACSEPQHTYLITTQGTGTPATRTVVVKRV